MRSLRSGAISFGLVHIPVKLNRYRAAGLKFNYLHSKCHTPIRYQKYCPACRTEVGQEDVVRGSNSPKGSMWC